MHPPQVPKYFAERLLPMLRRCYEPEDEAFHVVFLLFSHLDVHDVTRHCKLYEYNRAVNVSECLAFSGNSFNRDIL